MASLKYVANSSLQTVTLASNYTAGSGSMSLTSGHGARLPSSGDFWLSYEDGTNVRLFKVTGRSSNTLTVVADSTEGNGDANISSGQTLRWALTAAALTQLLTDIRTGVASVSYGITAMSALDIDCSTAVFFTKTINGNSTFTFSNPPATGAYLFTLELTHTSGTVTWPTSVAWPDGVTPALTTGKTHLFTFVTDNGGTRWRGSVLPNYTN